jgi:hypothetical protein
MGNRLKTLEGGLKEEVRNIVYKIFERRIFARDSA